MRYRDLLERLSKLNAEQLDQDVTIWDSLTDEYFPCAGGATNEFADVLDEGHYYLLLNR
jgi:hypothetical protein